MAKIKNVLIVITDMESGGAQKSLVSFLNSLNQSEKGNEYNIDLMIVKPKGIFINQIKENVNTIQADPEIIWMGAKLSDEYLRKHFSLKGLYGKLKCAIIKKFKLYPKKLNSEQVLWYSWNKLIKKNNKKYDIAVSYLNGYPNYYVMDKVLADKKVLWIHNEYQKLKYSSEFDRRFYENCDEIITISQECVHSFTEIFPQYKKKISILENISLSSEIIQKSKEYTPDVLKCSDKPKMVSVGRLTSQKGFDIAIEAAKLLKDEINDFLWVIVGDGPDRDELNKSILDNGLDKNVILVGIQNNPYAYISNADLFIQPSRFEGKSIVLDEAKILQRPIVVTNYPTVKDTITDGFNGSIVEMNSYAIEQGILKLLNDKNLQDKYIENLRSSNKSNEDEIAKYIEIML